MVELTPCGLYRTTRAIGAVPGERLVYFHNHGNPGPGLYLPASWRSNRVVWAPQGNLLPSPEDVRALEPLEPEGFYAVTERFHCCERKCRDFAPDTLVQLGYDGAGTLILFESELVPSGIGIPERGVKIDRDRISLMRRLQVRAGAGAGEEPVVH
jgi:hypothetical protein